MSDGPGSTATLIATGSQTVGPFFHFALTADGAVNAVEPPPHLPRIDLVVRVLDGEEQPVSDAAVELFYAAEAGAPYLFARLPTQEDGTCAFRIAQPVASSSPGSGPAAAHVNVCLFARGLLRQLHTRIYFEGDRALEDDAVLNLVPGERRATLLARRDGAQGGRWLFDVRLQGAHETVFFDV